MIKEKEKPVLDKERDIPNYPLPNMIPRHPIDIQAEKELGKGV